MEKLDSGNGVVIDPWALLSEIGEIKKLGVNVTPKNFMISSHHLFYLFIKKWMKYERMQRQRKIGTTRRELGMLRR